MAPRNGNGNGRHKPDGETSKHPAVVEMQSTLDEISRQMTLDDFLERHVERLRAEQRRNIALQDAFCDLDIDAMSPWSEEDER